MSKVVSQTEPYNNIINNYNNKYESTAADLARLILALL